MATRQEKHETQDGALTRRRFLSTSCLAASALGVGLPARPLWAQGTSASPTIDRIDPGYIGPQFFDEHERQALMDVVDSGSPFRYWGPGTPTKVLRFEEGTEEAVKPKTANELKGDTKLVALLRSAVEAASEESGWAHLRAVGSNIAKQAPEFDPRNYGYAKLRELALATKLFDVDERVHGDGHSRAIYIRDKRKKPQK